MYRLTIAHRDHNKNLQKYVSYYETLPEVLHKIRETLPEIHKKAGLSDDLAYFHTEETINYIYHKIGSHASTAVETADDFAMVRVTQR